MTDAELEAERRALARESAELKAEQRKRKRNPAAQRELSRKLKSLRPVTAFTACPRARDQRRGGGSKA